MIWLILILLPLNAMAVDQSQEANSGAQSNNMGNAQTIKNYGADGVRYSGGYSINGMPVITSPSLTTTLQDTCMGSTSGGVSIMGFGMSGGSTWKDEECIRRLNAKAVAEVLGDREAAKEILCGNQEVFAAFVTLGRPCRMPPSYTELVPGGALASYRVPVPPGKYGVHNGKLIIPGEEPDMEVTVSRVDPFEEEAFVKQRDLSEEEGYVERLIQHTGKDL